MVPTQGEMLILEAGHTALVISQTLLNNDRFNCVPAHVIMSNLG